MNRVVFESDWRPLLNLKPNASMPPCNNALAIIPVRGHPYTMLTSNGEEKGGHPNVKNTTVHKLIQ